MKWFLACAFFLGITQIKANDTLTRAQVYSFSVGDTFDYQHYNHYRNHQYIDTSYTNYSRKVVTNIYYSGDSSIEFIERTTIYPNPSIKDTLALTDLQTCELCMDTSNYFYPCMLTFSGNATYAGRTVNNIVFWKHTSPPEPEEIFFAQGLGDVMDIEDGGYLGGAVNWADTVRLIYYAGISYSWGNPYYTFPTEAANLSDTETNIFPMPNDGRFELATSLDKPPVEFWVYDMLGKVVLYQVVNSTNIAFDLQQYGSGLYFWKLTEQNKIARSGKIIVR